MAQVQDYDAVVIGAGQAGGPLSTALARAGRKTALIEREHVGGTCINEGCTPTKTMVASGRVAYLARRGADYGVQTGPVIHRYARRCGNASATSWTASATVVERRIEATRGRGSALRRSARFTGPKTLEVQLKAAVPDSLTAADHRDQYRCASRHARRSPGWTTCLR